MRHPVLFVLGISLVGLSACQRETVDWPRVTPPVAAPDFTLPRLDDGTVTLSALHGRVVVMEFWATWCGPCRFSTPSLDAIYRKFHNRNVEVLLINEGEDAGQVRSWVKGRFQAPVLLDQDIQVGQRYRLRGIPMLFVINQRGEILYVRSGYGGGLERTLTAVLNELLTEPLEGHHGG